MKLFQSKPAPIEFAGFQRYASCSCFEPVSNSSVKWSELQFHTAAVEETEGDRQLAELVALTAERGLKAFNPRKELGWVLWAQVTSLPASIATMQEVETIEMYGSHLVSIPPEIGRLQKLRLFDVYTSYRLHWFPYEIATLPQLASSRISTRALYGNYKYRPPFPRLPSRVPAHRTCSVCSQAVEEDRLIQRWTTRRVGSDRMPLLVNACSTACLARVPAPDPGEIPKHHKGGVSSRPPKGPDSYQ